MKKIIFALIILSAFQSVYADAFENLKKKLKNAPCMEYSFISLIESDIFDTVDSTFGTANIAQDGRYYVAMAEEVYAYDLNQYFTYVIPNNQLIIEQKSKNSNDDILFITKLDEFYKSYILRPDLEYKLIKKDNVVGDFPDSLTIRIDKEKLQFAEISFIDVNEELNRIVFQNQIFHKACIDSLLIPNFPDSVERVKL